LLKESNVTVPSNAELEISHHFGLDHFESVGMSMITVVNREYCKKLLILLPGQRHPAMYHKVKDETFFLLHGDITLLLDDVDTPIELGETVHIQPGVVHEFWTKNGAIIEEVSSNHSHTDSFYIDEKVSQNLDRKTFVKYWS
jgi:D-lyxose ketol-isomerase